MKLLNRAECEKAIASIKTRGANLDKDIHTAAVSTLDHLDKHGDSTLCNRLLAAMPKSGRRNALAAWMVNFGRLSLNMDKTTKAETPLLYDKEKECDIPASIALPFWEFKASEGGTTFVMDVYLASVTKRLTTALKTITDPVQREHAEKAILALSAIAAVKPTAPVVAAVEELNAAMPV